MESQEPFLSSGESLLKDEDVKVIKIFEFGEWTTRSFKGILHARKAGNYWSRITVVDYSYLDDNEYFLGASYNLDDLDIDELTITNTEALLKEIESIINGHFLPQNVATSTPAFYVEISDKQSRILVYIPPGFAYYISPFTSNLNQDIMDKVVDSTREAKNKKH
jgi:hypothetical protein